MPDKVLITGNQETAAAVAEAVRELGGDPVVADPGTGPADGETIDRWVQLPVTVAVSGESVVHRVSTFLQDGLMARFRLADELMPRLAAEGTVVLVTGNTPTPGGAGPDDRAARVSLLEVLAHAMRAEKAPGALRVKVIDGSESPQALAAAAMGSGSPSRNLPNQEEIAQSYEDWRTEVVGLVRVDF